MMASREKEQVVMMKANFGSDNARKSMYFANAPFEIIDGDRGKNYPKKAEFTSKGHCLFLNAGNVTKNGFDFSDNSFISKEKDKLLRKGKLERNDVVLTTRGTVGNVAWYSDDIPYENIRINSGMVILRASQSDLLPRYLYLFLCSKESAAQLELLRSGTAQPQLPIRDLKKARIPLPSLQTQKAIAHILGTLDDKIELNRRMNETLEAMAQALFKSWFLDFDPVKAKMESRQPEGMDAETAALFPDKLVESELGMIPEGWEVGCLKDVATNIRETVKPKDLHDTVPYIGLEHMPKKSIALSQWEYADKVTSNKSRFKSGDFLFGKLRPYFHKVGIAAIDGICSTDILVVRPKDENYYSFIISYISSEEFIDYTDRLSNGAKMPRTNWKDMGKYPIPLPSAEIARCFLNVVKPLYEKIARNIYQTKELSAARDALLPKLISGEINTTELS